MIWSINTQSADINKQVYDMTAYLLWKETMHHVKPSYGSFMKLIFKKQIAIVTVQFYIFLLSTRVQILAKQSPKRTLNLIKEKKKKDLNKMAIQYTFAFL